MATIKSFTDIEQSKELTKILPLESADMCYVKHSSSYNPSWVFNKDLPPMILAAVPINEITVETLPCWSLAALLAALPAYLFEFERGIDLNVYPNLNGKGWYCSYMPNCIENMKTNKFRLMISGDNLINACYEMILKLHELKLL